MYGRWLVTTVAALAMPVVAIDAQMAELQPGTRVRVRAPSAVAGRLTGVVLARSGDSVTISRPDAMPIVVPLRALTSLEVSRGTSRGRAAGKGALWGGGTFLVLGAVLPADSRPCKEGQVEPNCDRIGAAENAIYAGIGGAIIGALIGTAIGTERWERATLPATMGVGPSPLGRGVRFEVRVAARR